MFKKSIAISCLVILHVLLVQALYSSHLLFAQVTNDTLFGHDSQPYGNSYSEWTGNWWKWFLKMPEQGHPFNDLNGEKCGSHQSGPVWFLLGTDPEKVTTVDRNCTVPYGKAILFPIVATECNPGELGSGHLKTEDEIRQCAINGNNGIDSRSLFSTLDTKNIPDLFKIRIESPMFNATFPNGGMFGAQKGTYLAASDGYWEFLKPLTKGNHTIYWQYAQGSSNPDRENTGSSTNKVTYHLTVK